MALQLVARAPGLMEMPLTETRETVGRAAPCVSGRAGPQFWTHVLDAIGDSSGGSSSQL